MGKILNYTTEVPVDRTVSEIERLLSRHGVLSHKSYDGTGNVVALEFDVRTAKGDRSIRLPANIEAVEKLLASMGNSDYRRWDDDYQRQRVDKIKKQAARTAWRIIKDWVEAQLAIIDTEMVALDEVFLPYMITNSGQTFYQVMAGHNFLLPAGEKQSET